MAHKILVAPSILSADFARLAEEIEKIKSAGADWVHVDVMDGHFVNNITIGPPVVASIRKATKMTLDVHLMIETPEKYVDEFLKAGSDYLTIHVESTTKHEEIFSKIRKAGAKPGITLRPQTPVKEIEKFLPQVDLALVMTVNPGFGGQSFLHDQLAKMEFLKNWSVKNSKDLKIEVDGGINPETAKLCRDAGANVFVAGNAVFRSKDYAESIRSIRGS